MPERTGTGPAVGPGRRAARDGYVLGDRDRTEVERLRFQHEVWRDASEEVFDRAGFGPGDTLADLGCGPGHVAVDLVRRVGTAGRILAIDRSEHFIGVLRERARREGLDILEPRVGDIMDPPLEPGSLDGAVCRWVLMFLSDPEAALAGVSRALKPGGRFVAIEYLRLRSLALYPEGHAFETLYGAVDRLIRSSGGDPDIGARLPALLTGVGLEVSGLRPIIKAGRPGSPEWRWLEDTHANNSALIEEGLLTAGELEDFNAEWARASSDSGAFFSGPLVIAVTAQKSA